MCLSRTTPPNQILRIILIYQFNPLCSVHRQRGQPRRERHGTCGGGEGHRNHQIAHRAREDRGEFDEGYHRVRKLTLVLFRQILDTNAANPPADVSMSGTSGASFSYSCSGLHTADKFDWCRDPVRGTLN